MRITALESFVASSDMVEPAGLAKVAYVAVVTVAVAAGVATY